MITPPVYGFSAEFRGEHPAFDDFDDYLRLEFAKQHPGWEPRFGKATWFDPAVDRYDYMYLLHGNVPHAVDVIEETVVLDTFSPPREDLIAQDQKADN